MEENSQTKPVSSQGPIPKEVAYIYNRIAPLLATLQPLIRQFRDNEERVSFVTRQLQPYEDRFIAMVKAKRGKSEAFSLEVAVRMYGTGPSFGLIIAMTLLTAVEGKEPEWKEGSEPSIKVKDVLPFATQLRDHFGSNHRAHFEISVVGLVYDVLMQLARKDSTVYPKILELAKQQVQQGLKLSTLARSMARQEKALKLENFLEATIFLKRTGRLVMAILNPNYLDFASQLSGKDFRSPFAHLAEIKAYGISNNVVSCMLCKFIPGLNEVNAALLFYDYPFMVNDGVSNNEIYDLVNLCQKLDRALLPNPAP